MDQSANTCPYTQADVGKQYTIQGHKTTLVSLQALNRVGDPLVGPTEPAVKMRATFLLSGGSTFTVDYPIPPGQRP